MYVVTRDDLGTGYQIVQTAHAAAEFSLDHPTIARSWRDESRYMVVLTAPDEAALATLALDAQAKNIPVTKFYEPDVDDQLTAVAFGPGEASSDLLASLPLAGGGKR